MLGAALAGAALNLRYIGIVASLSDSLSGLTLRAKLIAIHITGDENWALTMSERAKPQTVGAAFLIGSCHDPRLDGFHRVRRSGGTILPDLEKFDLGVAFTAAFTAMARGLWRSRSNASLWMVTSGTATAMVLLGIPKAYAIAAGALLGLFAPFFVRRHRPVAL